MPFTLKALQRKAGQFELPLFVSLPLVVLAVGTALYGLSAFPKLLLAVTTFSLEELWSLVFFAFLAGFVYRFHAGESDLFSGHALEPPDHTVTRLLLCVAVFGTTLACESDLTIEWQRILAAVPKALLALGVFLLVIALPWQSTSALERDKKHADRVSHSRYCLDGRRTADGEWVRIATYTGGNGSMDARFRVQHEADSGVWRELRLLYEVGHTELLEHRWA